MTTSLATPDTWDIQSAPKQEMRLRAVAQRLLDEARRQGADACRLMLTAQHGLRVVISDGTLAEVARGTPRTARIDVFCAGRPGTAIVTGDIGDAGALVATAIEQARHAPVNPSDPLPFPDAMAWDAADSGLYFPANIGIAEIIDYARSCHQGVADGAGEHRVVSARSSFQSVTHSEVVANSLGLLVSRSSTIFTLECDAGVARNGQIAHASWRDAVRELHKLTPPSELGAMVARRALGKLGAQPLASGQYRALLEPQVASGFAEQLVAAMAGPLVVGGGSWMANRRGLSVAAAWMDIDEDPLLADGLNNASFDGGGYATAPRRLVSGGQLNGFLHDCRSAMLLGEPMTGHSSGTHNIIVHAPDERRFDPATMLGRLENGVVIAETFGVGVDLAAGTFSLGASGFRVEAGRVVEPVDRFMISGTFGGLFEAAEAMGTDTERRGNVRIGSLLVPAMTISGE